MKTTVELPDDLFREAKATAARRGTALKEYFREALAEKLAREAVAEKLARETAAIYPAREKQWPVPPPDVPLEELQRIDAFIEQAFEQLDIEE